MFACKVHAASTCCTSAPVASQSAEMELMEEMRCARKALAVSLDSSADHRLAFRMRSVGIQCSYTLASTLIARCPLSVSFPPIRTCAGSAGMRLDPAHAHWHMPMSMLHNFGAASASPHPCSVATPNESRALLGACSWGSYLSHWSLPSPTG